MAVEFFLEDLSLGRQIRAVQRKPLPAHAVSRCPCVRKCGKSLQSYLTLCDTMNLGFLRQEYWSGLPCPPPGDSPNLGIKPVSLASLALAVGFFTTNAIWEAPSICVYNSK